MIAWRYNPADYEVGSDLWIRESVGWSSYRGELYRVAKKTPSGQIVAKKAGHEVRISAKGKVAGDAGYDGRRPCSEREASEMNAQQALERAWRDVRRFSDLVGVAARDRSGENLTAARDDLLTAISKVLA